jgi:hypothetical protein
MDWQETELSGVPDVIHRQSASDILLLMQVKVQYLGILREFAGRESETLVCVVGFGRTLSRRSSVNQPRSSSNRRSGIRRSPSITGG